MLLLQIWFNIILICLVYICSQKRQRARQEKRLKKKEDERKRRQNWEENRSPAQTERDGIIHVETQHPRSSIIIIKATEDEDPPKKLNRDSTFLLPSVCNVFTNRDENDYFNQDQNHNSIKDDGESDTLAFSYLERTEFVDKVEDNENDTIETGAHEINTYHEDNSADEEEKNIIDTETSEDQHCVQDKEIRRVDNCNCRYNSNSIYRTDFGCHGHSFQDDSKMEDSCSNSDEEAELDRYENCLKELYPKPLEKKYERYMYIKEEFKSINVYINIKSVCWCF